MNSMGSKLDGTNDEVDDCKSRATPKALKRRIVVCFVYTCTPAISLLSVSEHWGDEQLYFLGILSSDWVSSYYELL